MQSEDAETGVVVNRLKRAHGQLGGVLRMVEEGRDLHEVVGQLKAVGRALDRAGFVLLAAEMRQHLREGGVPEEHLERVERLFLSLA